MMQYTAVYVVFLATVLWRTSFSTVTETIKKSSNDVTINSVSSLQPLENEYKNDFNNYADVLVEKMLAAADSMTANDAAIAQQLEKALQILDETSIKTGDLIDHTFATFMELYPAWLSYAQGATPAIRERKFEEYKELLNRFEKGNENMVKIAIVLASLQTSLLPSNVLPDPDNRIETYDISDTLKHVDEL